MLSGNNGILQRATDSKEKTTVAGEKEQIQIAVLGSYNDNAKLEVETVNSNIKNNISGITTDDATEFPLTVTYTATGNKYTVNSEGIVEKKEKAYEVIGAGIGVILANLDDLEIFEFEKAYIIVESSRIDLTSIIKPCPSFFNSLKDWETATYIDCGDMLNEFGISMTKEYEFILIKDGKEYSGIVDTSEFD